jgi:aarF domain-containing kinase
MSRLLFTGRLCLRHAPVQQTSRQLFSSSFRPRFRPNPSSRQTRHSFGKGRKALIASATTLTPLAFVQLSQTDSDDGKTHEERMLEQSRAELANAVPKRLENSKVVRRGIYFFIDTYIWEPIATTLRFLHLVVIFVPVIVTIPVIWLGDRMKDRDNERKGTLWWYGFLVWSMERAGAAFIKVCPRNCIEG